MVETFGISAQGTIVRRSIDPNWPDDSPQGGVVAFEDIAELGNIKPPQKTRKEIETTVHNSNDERVIVGIRRKGGMTINLNFLPSNASHDHLTGLQQAWDDGSRDIYQIEYPDGSGETFSGYVTNIGPSAPVDDKLSADVTIKPTNHSEFF